MKNKFFYSILLLFFIASCSKAPSPAVIPWSGNLVAFSPVPISKTNNKKIFTHFMPWFETKATSNDGFWGEHWTMVNENPDFISNGQRQIASYYYPLTGPYGSGDTIVIDYQLLLMKLSGIDGIFIDWPGTTNYSDFVKNVENTNIIVSRLQRVGLKYAIVYEDQNLQYASSSKPNQITAAQADMQYIQSYYFRDTATTYETYNGRPLLLDFGPFGPLNTASDWNTVFSVLSTAPAFFTYEGRSGVGGTNARGEFAWVQESNVTNLNNFYSNNYSGEKVSVAYPGFNSFYAQGGWPNTTPWTIPYNNGGTTTFQQTLSLALQQSGDYVQLVTWNDYGEGTMIEPTVQFQYSYLTTLQQQLGVRNLSQADLELVNRLYTARKNSILPTYNQANLNRFDQVFYYIASLQMDSARALMSGF